MRSLQRPLLLALLAAPLAAQQELYRTHGPKAGSFLSVVAGVGDVDGDGFGDYATGMPSWKDGSGNKLGLVEVRSGRTGLVLSTSWSGPDERYGTAIAGIGDVNKDGFDDFAVGAPSSDDLAQDGGQVTILAGGTFTPLDELHDSVPFGELGAALCGLGDVDGDGWPDYLIGRPGGVAGGEVQVFTGSGHYIIDTIPAPSGASRFGDTLANVGDLDGDGVNDFVVGAPFSSHFGSGNGWAIVYSGATRQPLFERFGAYDYGRFGHAVAGVGDVNGDGVPDVAFGEPEADANGSASGRVLVSSGKWPYPQLHHIVGAAGAAAGSSLAGLGDVDGDGRSDFAIGMPESDFFTLSQVGMVSVRSGATGDQLAALLGATDSARLGWGLGAADLNRDGVGDLLTAAPGDDASKTDAGEARAYLMGGGFAGYYCDGKLASTGCTPKIAVTGAASLSVGDGPLFRATAVPNNVPGLFLWSLSSNDKPFFGGKLCLGGSIVRTGVQVSGGNGGVATDCSGEFNFAMTPAYMGAKGLQPGDVVHGQFWCRDPGYAQPNNVGLTRGAAITVLP
jgi:hypothetical protein